MNDFLPFALLILSVTIASFSQVLLKKSALKQPKSILFEYLNPYVIVGYGMTFTSMVLSVFAYSMVEYKNGPLIESLGFVIVMLLSYFFFREKLTKKKLVGGLLIVGGIVIFYL